jgi:hypothetical protein
VSRFLAMFVEIKVRYSALFTNLVGWHAGAVSFPLSDVILAQIASPLSDIMICLHSGITNLSPPPSPPPPPPLPPRPPTLVPSCKMKSRLFHENVVSAGPTTTSGW